MTQSNEKPRYPKNVAGPFYVEDSCCLLCAIPETYAPELFGMDTEAGEATHCFVKKQPENATELDRMFKVLKCQELGCIRYSGTDETILNGMRTQDIIEYADHPDPPDTSQHNPGDE